MGRALSVIFALFVDYDLLIYYVEIHQVVRNPGRGCEFL